MKQELLGVAFNRIMRMDIHTGDHTKTWRFNTMKAWNVNWEVMLITELTIRTNLPHTNTLVKSLIQLFQNVFINYGSFKDINYKVISTIMKCASNSPCAS